MKNLLEKLAFIELVLGILITLIGATYATYIDGGLGLTIGVLCGGAFGTAIGYAFLGGFAELLDKVNLIYKLMAKDSDKLKSMQE